MNFCGNTQSSCKITRSGPLRGCLSRGDIPDAEALARPEEK